MKQFATGTAVLKTPRPITFELAFFFFFKAVVTAAAACKMSHILFLPGRGRSLPSSEWGCPAGWAVVI